jgi:hypothetical protein
MRKTGESTIVCCKILTAQKQQCPSTLQGRRTLITAPDSDSRKYSSSFFSPARSSFCVAAPPPAQQDGFSHSHRTGAGKHRVVIGPGFGHYRWYFARQQSAGAVLTLWNNHSTRKQARSSPAPLVSAAPRPAPPLRAAPPLVPLPPWAWAARCSRSSCANRSDTLTSAAEWRETQDIRMGYTAATNRGRTSNSTFIRSRDDVDFKADRSPCIVLDAAA